jgi:hypothetical protein
VKTTSARIVASSSINLAEIRHTAANNAAPASVRTALTRESSSVSKKLARRPGTGYEGKG